ncbi:MAG: thiamine pyrophosphate-binding protein [Parvibaculaceae bacterium]|nr:thiamine pyrophosphate-binding protein [Parvibaculaceae bacterium]HBM88772.1 acetolactate synthase [Rhodobiaceae bacterium]
MKTGAQIIAHHLYDAGCRTAFGIPGGEVLAVVDALTQSGIQFVLTKHENSAGFMAEGAWHATGAPGILVATLGPGVANAVNVVANAHQDKVPLIFLTGRVDAAEAETYTHQVFDHQALLRPVVKASFCAAPGAVGAMIEKALLIATEGQPGPVHIDVPIGTAEGAAPEEDRPFSSAPALGGPPVAGLERVIASLEAAERPLAIAGVDAVNEEAGPAIQAFCERYGVPLITSYKGKGLINETHPLAIGGAGLSPKADKVLMPLIERSDLIFLIGYDPIEMRVGWRNPWGPEKQVVEITPVVRTHGMHRVSMSFLSPIADTLSALSEATARETWTNGEASLVRTDLATAFTTTSKGFSPGHVYDTLRKVLPDNTVMTTDSGAHRILLSQKWTTHTPRTLLQSSALCTMGCAVPIAAGYKLCAPSVPVATVLGDAGLEMILGELATIRDLKLPLVITVMVDESLGLIEMKQRAMGRANTGVDFDGTDFPAVADAMGGKGVWVDDVETLEREASAALNRNSFTLLACRIGRRAYDGAF